LVIQINILSNLLVFGDIKRAPAIFGHPLAPDYEISSKPTATIKAKNFDFRLIWTILLEAEGNLLAQ